MYNIRTNIINFKNFLLFSIILFALTGCTATKTSNPDTQNTQSQTTISAQKSENQQACEAIISPEQLNQFSGHTFTYQEDPLGVEGNFSCIFATNTGPGSRTIIFRTLADSDKITFEAAKSAGDTTTDASEFDEAYYSSSIIKQSDTDPNTTPELSLHVHKNGKTYTVNTVQYKSEAETKVLINQIVTKLMSS